MSKAESNLLRELGITNPKVAHYIGVTRQAVTRGVEGDSQYIDGDRAAMIFARLQDDNEPDVAESFRSQCIDKLGIRPDSFLTVPVTAERDTILDPDAAGDDKSTSVSAFGAAELWVFTAQPREVYQRGYLSSIAERVYDTTNGSSVRRMIFFVPSEICQTLTTEISGALSKITSKNRVKIQIISCNSLRFSPHYVIINPRDIEPKGYVSVEIEDRFQQIPELHLKSILNNIVVHGFSINADEPSHGFRMPMMEMFFDSIVDMEQQ